jgi:tRNA(fMet)-specific endonuclease VapC
MHILDTDHLSVLQESTLSEAGRNVTRRLRETNFKRPNVTIISLEEQFRGWMAVVAKQRTARRQVNPYRRFQELFTFLQEFNIVAFDDRAADRFESIRGLSIGAMDLKIAAICLVNDATLLTRNSRDFSKVPGLKFEDWTL